MLRVAVRVEAVEEAAGVEVVVTIGAPPRPGPMITEASRSILKAKSMSVRKGSHADSNIYGNDVSR